MQSSTHVPFKSSAGTACSCMNAGGEDPAALTATAVMLTAEYET